jgi:hypothetical protein
MRHAYAYAHGYINPDLHTNSDGHVYTYANTYRDRRGNTPDSNRS